ncbi:ABC transporter ATP-binding protein/permease [uncultured Corynebacterium sp.]|uniref:ABC transporter ATP-binding protein/permease n=1 Tax=uncultured Corynebacterium sp. TaxID=159447 RepID=UPI0025976140|nr:ABC transporter transmembrane domain-containing protein [uncultured Corynebacterium sp.]
MASPVNPRLLRLVPPVRGLIVRAGVYQGLATALVVARGVVLGVIAASVVEERQVSFAALFLGLGAILAAHGAVVWAARRASARAVGQSVDKLREQALRALAREDPRVVEEQAATWRHVLTRGMDDFRPYLSEFVPSLVALAVATPAALAAVFAFDWVSGVLAAVTLPLIPAFMVLIGRLTVSRTERRLRVTAGLGQQLADLLGGAPTLRALHATARPARQIREIGARHEEATMGVLRLAFLSSFALEFLATLSVALVAVSVGLRLVYGEISLLAGLVVLIVVPEVFAPVRRVGTNYHAAADGLEAAEKLLQLIDATPAATGAYLSRAGEGLAVRDLCVRGRDGVRPDHLTFTARPGAVTVLAGPNGAGKSTVFLAALGALPDAAVSGSVRVGGQAAYAPPRPATVPGTVRENLALMGTAPRDPSVGVALDQRIGVAGRGVSAGQLQRIGLARALASDAPVLLLDEPTAHLSPALVGEVLAALHREAVAGRTVVVASHDPRVVAAADEVVRL